MSSPACAVRAAVVLDLDDLEGASALTVLSAALQLFGPQDPVDVLLVLPGVAEPQDEHGLLVQELVLALVPDATALPEVLLVGPDEVAGREVLLRVPASGNVAADARAVVMLSTVAQGVWAPGPPAELGLDVLREVQERAERLAAERDRAVALERVARRDVVVSAALRRGDRRPQVVLLFQHRSYWGAVATLWQALAGSPDVDVHVVALDSTADGRGASTAAFLAEHGVPSRTPAWLLGALDDVDVVVLVDPYDETRPAGLRVPDLAVRGVRLVAVPYGGNAVGGAFMATLLWDLPLQRLAWRAYLASEVQERLFAEHCRAGGKQVRVLGTPKTDRVVQAVRGGRRSAGARAWRERAAGRPLVLWNPHFRVGSGGWSTFERHLAPMLEHLAADPSVVVLLRPHFRLWPDLQQLGGAGTGHERVVRAFAARHDTLLLDETPDPLDALTACDAMLSDLSSLATELLPAGTPVLYLHREDGPGPNEEGAHFSAMYRADSWADVEAFLAMVARGEDPRRDERAAVVRRDLPHADGGAGARVADDLVASLLSELALVPAALPGVARSRA